MQTKRDLYYQNVNMMGSQSICDAAIEDIAVSLGVERGRLNLVGILSNTYLGNPELFIPASSKGLVFGNLVMMMKDGSVIDASQGATLVPAHENVVSFFIECR